MPVYLNDLAARRLGELARILAGCSLVEPVLVLRLLTKINPYDIQNERARQFLALLTEKKNEVEAADDMRAIEIVGELAFSNGFVVDYAQWLSLVTEGNETAAGLAEKTIIDIQSMIIASRVICDLQTMGREIEFRHGQGNYAERRRSYCR